MEGESGEVGSGFGSLQAIVRGGERDRMGGSGDDVIGNWGKMMKGNRG